MSSAPSPENKFLTDHVARLVASHDRLVGKNLLPPYEHANLGQTIFSADFALLSSGLEDDPLFTYANKTALDLFELTWTSLIALPARESAEADLQSKRDALMREVREKGFVTDYSGIRISASGRRFTIEGATIWNVIDDAGVYHGQAASFSRWQRV